MSAWLFWSFSITFMNSQFPPLFIAAFINFKGLHFRTSIEIVSSIFTILTTIALPIGLVLEFYIIRKYTQKMESEEFKKKYSKLVDGLNTEKSIGQYWNPIILVRWAITNTILVALRESF